jgi:8-oxo-dGTP pyrophosphatase MutT (NUDIX family)
MTEQTDATAGRLSQVGAGLMRHVLGMRVGQTRDRVIFRLAGAAVGWVARADAARLQALGCTSDLAGVTLEDAADLPGLVAALAARGAFRLRGEAFDVRANPDASVLAHIDRGALPWFGIQAHGVHLNGLVRRPNGLHLWVAHRSRRKLMDPGKLDHVVAGGVPAGLTPGETLVKEAAEEAGMPAALARGARPVGQIAYVLERPEGLRRDVLHCYDLDVPEDFLPTPNDDEVERFALWPIDRVLQTAAVGDDFKFNVNFVLIDLFLRLGLIDPESADGRALRHKLSGGSPEPP